MNTNSTLPLLVRYVNKFLEHRDVERLHDQVCRKYTTGTLCRLLRSKDVRLRRSASLALGLTGESGCQSELIDALHDEDEVVREWSEKSLWLVWFRSSDDQHNLQLQSVAYSIARDRPAIAVDEASTLIKVAPNFAEAYNQRAIAYWRLGMWDDAIEDCRQTLSLNPDHFGASAGLGQCFLQKGDLDQAVDCFERALEINPNLDGIAEILEQLRGDTDFDATNN